MCATLLAFAVGFVYLLPHLLFIIEAGTSYCIPFLAMPDERHYASRIREVYDAHYTIANPDLREYKDSPYFWQPLSEIIVGSIGKLFGLTLEELLVASDFVFPCILFVIIYGFGCYVTQSRSIALLATCGIMMVSIFIVGPPQALVYLIARFSFINIPAIFNPKSSFLFTRSINPQINSILFFLFMIEVYRSIFRESKRDALFAGILLGGFFYCSFYYWSYVIAGCSIYGIYALLTKKHASVWRLALIITVGAILSIPYWIGFYQVHASPVYDEVTKRYGFYFTHKPYLPKIELLPILLFLVVCPKKEGPYLFLASFFLGGIICENQHILTGKRFHPYHWSIYCQAPLIWIAFALIVSTTAKLLASNRLVWRIRQRGALWTSLLLLCVFLNAIHTQVVYVYATDREQGPRSFYEESLPMWIYYQKLGPVIRWLNAHAEKDSVVLSATWPSELITAFTHCNILVGWHTQVYLVSDQELWERWLLKCYFFGVPTDKVFDVLRPNLDGILFLPPWGHHGEVPTDFRLWLETLYRGITQQPLLSLLAKYNVDYVLLSRSEREEYHIEETGFTINRYPFLTQVVSTGDIALYRITRENTIGYSK